MSKNRIGKNVFYNLAGVVVPLLATLLTLPSYLHHIGEARYGMLSLIWLLFGYFGLFDFGLSRATANRLAKLRTGSALEKATVFYTAISLNIIVGIVMAIVFFALARTFIGFIIGNSSAITSEVPAAVGWLSVMFPLAMLGGVFVGSIEAEEKFFMLNIQQIVGSVNLQCLPLLFVIIWGAELKYAVMGAVVSRAISVLWVGISAIRSVSFFGSRSFSMKVGWSLLKYGGWVAISNLISPVMEGSDRILIGWLLGPQAIAQYSIPSSLTMKTLAIPAALSRALFPRFSGLESNEASQLASEVSLTLGSVMAMVCAPGILLTETALTWWLGAEHAGPMVLIAQILMLGTWANGMAFIPYTLLQSQGRPDLVAKFHAFEFLPFLIMLGVGVFFFGVEGAATAWSLRVSFDAVLLFVATGFFRENVKSSWLPLLLVLLSFFGVMAVHPIGLTAFFLSFCTFAAVLFHFLHSNCILRKQIEYFRAKS